MVFIGPLLFYNMENKIDIFNEWDADLMKFLTPAKAFELAQAPGTISSWDFNTSIGETIRDKYDSLFIKIIEITGVLLRKGATGFFWVVTSPEVFSIMDSATSDKTITKNSMYGVNQEAMGLQEGQLTDMGVMSRRWRVLVTPEWPTNMMLIGCGSKENGPNHYARLSIANFVI